MLPLLCITLPCAISIVFVVLFLLRKNKTLTDQTLLALSICSAIYFFAELNYISSLEDYKTLIFADIASQYARPLIPPLMLLCLDSMMRNVKWRWWMTTAFALSIIIGTVSMCVYIVMGIDAAAEYVDAMYENNGDANGYGSRIYMLYEIFCIWIYRLTIVIYSIICICRIMYLFRKTQFKFHEILDFIFRKGEIEPAHLMGILYIVMLFTIFIKLLIGRYYFADHQCCAGLFCLIRTVIIFIIGHIGLRNNKPTLSLSLLRQNYNEHHIIEEQKEESIPVNYADIASSEEISISNFNLISDNKLFLDSRLSLEQCAEQIGTNRTYLSKYISINYCCSFREYINMLRIEYAKDYMLEHRDYKQEVIAENCGFGDAPSFNKKFKQIVGKTPRMWLAM